MVNSIQEIINMGVVGSTGQSNIFDLRCSERTYDGTNRSPKLVA